VLLAPLTAREAPIGALALLSSEAERTFSASEVRVVQTIAGQVAAAIDTVRLLDEVRRQRDVAEALRQTATALSRNLDQQNVLGSILEQLDQVFAAEGAAVALVEDRDLATVAAKGLSAGSIGQRTALEGEGAAPCVLRGRKALLIEDTHSSETPVGGASAAATRCWLGAPLISGENAIGVLSLESTAPGSFTPAQANLLSTFADQAAIAVTNAHLYDQAQALAVAGERNRIARDLHDAVTQTIFSASLIASTLPVRLPALAQDVRADIEALQMLTIGALAEMRTLLLELRPERLAEVPLDVLLGQLAQAFTGRNGVPAEVDANCDPHYTPPYPIKIAFYRVAQEALNNVGKHAKAAHVTIRYSARPGALRRWGWQSCKSVRRRPART
jgi:signal transduction histidine kinase